MASRAWPAHVAGVLGDAGAARERADRGRVRAEHDCVEALARVEGADGGAEAEGVGARLRGE